MATVTITGSGDIRFGYIIIDGLPVTAAGDYNVANGTVITLFESGTAFGSTVIVNGKTAESGFSGSYEYTVVGNCSIDMRVDVGECIYTIVELGSGVGTHSVLIDSTAYGSTLGKTLIDGTSYEIPFGKTLVDGTAYEIAFGGGDVTITMSGKFNKSYGYVTVAGTNYMEAAEIVVPAGTQITVYVSASLTSYRPYCQVVKDGVTVKSGYGEYSFEAEKDTTLVFTNNTGGRANCYSCTITTS